MNSVNAALSNEQSADVPERERAHIGVLLERARRRMFDRWLERFDEPGFSDLRLAHSAVMAFLPADGARLTELARRARMTKQSMGELVQDLERRGYVERLPDPTDGRAKIVVFTDRGRAASRAALKAAAAVEEDWAREIGAQRTAELRRLLELIAGIQE